VVIGIVGLGVMGGAIASRLLAAGYPVQGYNRTAVKAAALAGLGLVPAATPREAALGTSITFSVVSDGDALAEVRDGPDGILAGLPADSVYIDLSTVGPAASDATRAAAQEHGARFLAAPVSGSVATVEQGKLAFMVGGDEATLEQVRPVLLDLGSAITHVGTVRQAAAMKLAVNLSIAAQMIAFSEGVLLAERYGIAAADAVGILLRSAVASPMLAYRGPFVLDPPAEPWVTIALARKDMRITMDVAEQAALPLWSASVAAQVLTAADAMGYGQDELASVASALRAMSAGRGGQPRAGA
jgi:3-hydroxyisobutyrate dehydrogenase-like beta-hydroxyacid dehydrogenase